VLSASLNLLMLAVILFVQFRVLAEIRFIGYVGMLSLLIITMASGALVAKRTPGNEKVWSSRHQYETLVSAWSLLAAVFQAQRQSLRQPFMHYSRRFVMVLVALAWADSRRQESSP